MSIKIIIKQLWIPALLISVIFAIGFLCAGCQTCLPCPKEDILIILHTGELKEIPKGFFDSQENEWTKEGLQKFQQDLEKKKNQKGL